MRRMQVLCSIGVIAAVVVTGCARRQKSALGLPPPPPPPADDRLAPGAVPPAPPSPRGGQPIVDNQLSVTPLADEGVDARNLEELNRDSPLKPAFFPLDSSELDDAARGVVAANADTLKQNPRWVVTIEGHCDERGTAEYNLALGERRAVSARTYLVSLGIPADRIKTVSYGKEFPFDPGHDESAWSKNRRAHFVVTAK